MRGHWDQTWRLHLIRAVLATIMLYLLFFGLTRIPLAQAVGLTFLAPIVALFLAPPILGERINHLQSCLHSWASAVLSLWPLGSFGPHGPESDWLGLIAVLVFACFVRPQPHVAAQTGIDRLMRWKLFSFKMFWCS